MGELACLFSDAGVITVVSLVSPYKADRDEVRKRHEEQGIKFLEVFMDVPLTVVQERDPKGLYKKVAAGEIKGFTGIYGWRCMDACMDGLVGMMPHFLCC